MSEEASDRLQGHIKWFNHQKRYGFIRRSDGRNDVFVHTNEFRHRSDGDWVAEGDPVEFVIEQTAKGPSAADVVIVRPAE